ncbi:MAG: pyridoxamine 5-phosphate oxidase, partial [Thermoleophilaceae bacterium]|nr:pyridoxamine 5-phosphate oxidase [Thermoleophilaceae bacterium]
TNYDSRKGLELAANPAVALHFGWYPLQRQVRVEGMAAIVPRAESEAYFATRPRGSQLGAWASRQSSDVASREELNAAYAEVERRFADADVPCPPHWGGYRVTPLRYEFWTHDDARLHHRVVYRRDGGGWVRELLSP